MTKVVQQFSFVRIHALHRGGMLLTITDFRHTRQHLNAYAEKVVWIVIDRFS